MIFVIWALALLTIRAFWNYFLYPYLYKKYTYWKLSKEMERIAEKYDGETKEKLNEIIDLTKKISRETKLGDED